MLAGQLLINVFENVRVAEIVLRQAFRVARDLSCYGRTADFKDSTDFFLDDCADFIAGPREQFRDPLRRRRSLLARPNPTERSRGKAKNSRRCRACAGLLCAG